MRQNSNTHPELDRCGLHMELAAVERLGERHSSLEETLTN
jgi:hypothetical protein